MKFLLDMGISPKVRDMLRLLGHQATRCMEDGLSCAPDIAVLEHARRGDMVLISTDLDFGDLVVARGLVCPGLLLLRLDNPSSDVMCRRLRATLTALPEDDIVGSGGSACGSCNRNAAFREASH